MSAAQALMSGLPTAASSNAVTGAQSRSGDSGREHSGASFREALDSAQGGKDPAAAKDQAPKTSSDSRSGERGDRDGEATSEAEAQAVVDLAAMLAALKGVAGATAASVEAAGARGLTGSAFGQIGSGAASGETNDTMALPGAVDPRHGDTVDVGALFDLVTGGGTAAETADTPTLGTQAGRTTEAVVQEIKVSVVHRETHLAIEPVRDEALRALDQGRAGLQGDATPATAPAPVSAAAAASVPGIAERASDRRASVDARATATGPGLQDGGPADAFKTGDGLAAQAASGQSQSGNGQSSQGQNNQGSNHHSALDSLIGGAIKVGDIASAGDDLATYVPVSEQIAAEVRAELTAGGMGETSSDGVLKMLHLELKPADLGSVTIKIALKDNAVTLHIEAQSSETLALIERDRKALTDALSAAGYAVEGITATQQSDGPRASASSGFAASGGDPTAQQQLGQGLSDSAAGQREQGKSGGDQPTRPGFQGKDETANSARAAADGLYV